MVTLKPAPLSMFHRKKAIGGSRLMVSFGLAAKRSGQVC